MTDSGVTRHDWQHKFSQTRLLTDLVADILKAVSISMTHTIVVWRFRSDILIAACTFKQWLYNGAHIIVGFGLYLLFGIIKSFVSFTIFCPSIVFHCLSLPFAVLGGNWTDLVDSASLCDSLPARLPTGQMPVFRELSGRCRGFLSSRGDTLHLAAMGEIWCWGRRFTMPKFTHICQICKFLSSFSVFFTHRVDSTLYTDEAEIWHRGPNHSLLSHPKFGLDYERG